MRQCSSIIKSHSDNWLIAGDQINRNAVCLYVIGRYMPHFRTCIIMQRRRATRYCIYVCVCVDIAVSREISSTFCVRRLCEKNVAQRCEFIRKNIRIRCWNVDFWEVGYSFSQIKFYLSFRLESFRMTLRRTMFLFRLLNSRYSFSAYMNTNIERKAFFIRLIYQALLFFIFFIVISQSKMFSWNNSALIFDNNATILFNLRSR